MDELKLVICDIDSTLVDSNRELSDKTREVINKLHDHHIDFGIASGRPLDELKRNKEKWKLIHDFDILIGMNGSELWDNRRQQEFDYYKLKTEWIKEIIELMDRFDTTYFIYLDGYILCNQDTPIMHHSATSSDKEIVVMDDKSQMYQVENAKIMFRVKEEEMEMIEEYVNAHPSPYYKAFKTQATLLEFADRRVSKAYALEKYCEMNDMNIADVMAFGDTSNDNELLKVSGHGVCMINGSDDTKAVADAITEKTNDEDGVAWYLLDHYFHEAN